MRRDLAVAAAALGLGLIGLAVGVYFLWSYVISPWRGPYDVEWLTADVTDRGRAVTVTYQVPCGSSYSHTATMVDDDRLVVTVFVEGRAWFGACPEVDVTDEVTVRLDERVDPAILVVDGS